MSRGPEGGFTYFGLLILLAVIGVAAAGTLQMGAVMQRHAAEEELLAIGADFRAALKSYTQATPAGMATAPRRLQDLVRDPRYPNPRRHLRHVPADPLTGREKWGLVLAPDGQGIVGIHSLSTDRPIKIANFPPEFQGFESKSSYTQWVFAPVPVAVRPQTQTQTKATSHE